MRSKQLVKSIIVAIVLIPCVTGCETVVTSSYCLVATRIYYEPQEIDSWSDIHARSVDNHNEKYEELCG